VKFSKLLRKKIYFDTFSNIPNTESKLGEIICQKCGSPNYKKFGVRHNRAATFNGIYAKIVIADSS
jgi:hypothetical protein